MYLENYPNRNLTTDFFSESYKETEWNKPDDIIAALKPSHKAHWVSARYKGAMIGIDHLQLVLPESCYVSNLIIRRKYRKRGIGKWFLKNIEAHCYRLGIRRLLLAADESSLGFYKILSFEFAQDYPNFLMKIINPHQIIRNKLLF